MHRRIATADGLDDQCDEDIAADHPSKEDHRYCDPEALWLIQSHHELHFHPDHEKQSGERMSQPPERSHNSPDRGTIAKCASHRRADGNSTTKRSNPKLNQKATFQKIDKREQEH